MTPQLLASVGLTLLLAASGAATAQVTVTALGHGLEPIESTTDIHHTHADFSETPKIQIGTELQVGDLLTSLDEDLFLELSCPQGSRLDFTGAFQVLINPPQESIDCAVRLDAGKLDVITDGGTEVESGEVTLGSEGTRYAVRIGSESKKLERVLVFEGEVEVEAPDLTEQVARGRALTFKSRSGRPREVAVTSEEIDRWARLYARFNTVQAKAAGTDPDFAELVRLHARVLRRPDDEEARAKLVEAQDSYRIDEASYHQRRTRPKPASSSPPVTPGRGRSSFGGCPAVIEDALTEETVVHDTAALGILLSNQRRAGTVTSKKYYALAVSQILDANALAADSGRISLEAMRRVAGETAKRALEAHAQDGVLSQTGVEFCRCLTDG